MRMFYSYLRGWVWLSCLLLAVPAFAQRLPGGAAVSAAEKTASFSSAARAGVARVSAARLRALLQRRTLAARPEYGPEAVRRHIRSAVFFMFNEEGWEASGFFLEEFVNGSRTVWAVIPAHVVSPGGASFSAAYYDLSGRETVLPLTVVKMGSAGYQNYDFALALVPDKAASRIFALRLADRPPKRGETLRSFGFNGIPGDGAPALHEAAGRKVLAVDGSRITTSYNFGPVPSGGACGGPLINARGEVAGIHSGSYNRKRSFAVEASGPVRELLAEFRGEKEIRRSVRLYGQELLALRSYERLSYVEIDRNGQLSVTMPLTKRQLPFDYNHMEKLLYSARPGDVLRFTITAQQAGRPEETREVRVNCAGFKNPAGSYTHE